MTRGLEMINFEQIRIWKYSLGIGVKDDEAACRDRLRVAFLTFRERAAHLAGEISRDLPEMTTHDLSHLDALWEMADAICGEANNLNPCEVFVLGGAFLLHDLGMSLAAYHKGLETLSKHPLYRDALVAQLEEALGKPLSESEIQSPPEPIRKHAIGQVLRSLHAELAETLLSLSWKDPRDGSEMYLLDDSE